MRIKLVLIISFLFLLIPIINSGSPPTIVYKTKSDYSEMVPIHLSEDKTNIVSFPDTKDIPYERESTYITELKQDYLFDNRGIGPNTVFLNITYEEYSELDDIPSQEEFFNMIIDEDPFIEIYDCGERNSFKDKEKELNKIIEEDRLDEECENLLTKKDSVSKDLNPFIFYGILLGTLLGIIIRVVIVVILKRKSKTST